MQPILEKLYRAESMSQQESQQLFSAIVRGELEPSQLAAALISMKVRGERPEEIAGAAKALLDDAQPFPRPDYPFADIVGTHAGDKGDLRPAAPGRHRLIRALAAKRHLILFPDHRFARVGELFNIEDMVGIDAAKNHQLTCFHRIDS